MSLRKISLRCTSLTISSDCLSFIKVKQLLDPRLKSIVRKYDTYRVRVFGMGSDGDNCGILNDKSQLNDRHERAKEFMMGQKMC